MRMNGYPEILAIQSDKKYLIQVENFIRLLFLKNNLPDESFNRVLLVVSEAVINAIEHGNKNDTRKKVTIKALCRENDLVIEVKDEGDGFNHELVADPTAAENIKKESGRGIFIMKSMCDRLNFHDKGKCVEIQIELT